MFSAAPLWAADELTDEDFESHFYGRVALWRSAPDPSSSAEP
ncbi:hypothetical protein [Streptomyces sp. NPDC005046]